MEDKYTHNDIVNDLRDEIDDLKEENDDLKDTIIDLDNDRERKDKGTLDIIKEIRWAIGNISDYLKELEQL